MAEYRLLADSWVRLDPDSLDTPRPRSHRYTRGDVVPNLLPEEIDYLTNGARPHLVEKGSDADPWKDEDADKSASEPQSKARGVAGDDSSARAQTAK
jgi:hypothetical protein